MLRNPKGLTTETESEKINGKVTKVEKMLSMY
ncbi:hypothetical protein Alsa1_CDS0003 [Staphylococcus phage Alsa_1]|nr:hypothetical protein Alsa1_CDS0003 [Staphylococcus phage Alsa_1]WNM50855.1 hypothetical protein Alsa2_CDS0241 [Staphylococcus phage Alsa_2]